MERDADIVIIAIFRIDEKVDESSLLATLKIVQ